MEQVKTITVYCGSVKKRLNRRTQIIQSLTNDYAAAIIIFIAMEKKMVTENQISNEQ